MNQIGIFAMRQHDQIMRGREFHHTEQVVFAEASRSGLREIGINMFWGNSLDGCVVDHRSHY